MEETNFVTLLRDLGLGLLAAAVPVLLAFLSRSANALFVTLERSIAPKATENLAWAALARLTAEVNDFINDASGIADGELAQFRRPESLGGVTVTDEEWKAWAQVLARRFVAGMGETWLQRLSDAIGLSPIGTKAKIEQVVASELMRRSDEMRTTTAEIAVLPPPATNGVRPT